MSRPHLTRAVLGIVAVASAAAVSCYKPNRAAPCTVTCQFGQSSACPDDLECHADGLCYAPNTSTCTPLDAPPGVDGPGSGSGSGYCFPGHGGLLAACFSAPASDSVMLGPDNDVDTSASNPFCQVMASTGGELICASHHHDILVPSAAMLRAHGTYPLALFADGEVIVEGTIDVSTDASGVMVVAGAGANTSCSANPGTFNLTGGGGGGGGYQSNGGGGGNSTTSMDGAPGGASIGAVLAGGCSGGSGGGAVNKPAGIGGIGGGVAYVMANGDITVGSAARILASGGGGGGGGVEAGGGGGGAGGLIALDAPTVTTGGASFVALGGGGGGGGTLTATGNTGNTTLTCTAATGGGASATAGFGGNGGTGNGAGGTGGASGSATAGAGGGGGGAGYIKIFGTRFGSMPIACPPIN